jgi:hypothetical protein
MRGHGAIAGQSSSQKREKSSYRDFLEERKQ